MKSLQTGRAYPIKSPKLKTKRDQLGNRYPFRGTHMVPWRGKRIRVVGRDSRGTWCRITYKYKNLPKWLQREIGSIGKM